MKRSLLTLALRRESDLVSARQRARQISALLGFPKQDQTRIATAVSEICRNAIRYAGGGHAEFELSGAEESTLIMRVRDEGPGIACLPELRNGTYRSSEGMGLGIVGAERLVDTLDIQTGSGKGTTVTLTKHLPPGSTPMATAALIASLERQPYPAAADELETQNRELMAALADLRERQEDLQRLNRELEETNRGVVALYAELDERADRLRLADETKSKFLSHLSHEFRTPVNSIRALARLLIDHVDGPLGEEQERQVRFIRQAAETLTDLLNDVLDLGKIEAGRVEITISSIELSSLFGTLRGLFKPLANNPDVRLVIDEPHEFPPIFSDENKIAQILRNLVSNALKFTESGEVIVEAGYDAADDRVMFDVSDTGIGIAPEHRERIFEEYAQINHALQRRVKGTGLGLALSRRLAGLLGGTLTLHESELGQGSRFRLTLPRQGPEVPSIAASPQPEARDTARRVALIVEDDEAYRYLLRRPLEHDGWTVHEAFDAEQGRALAVSLSPTIVFLDLNLPDDRGESVLATLKGSDATRHIPVIVVTSRRISPDDMTNLREAEDVWRKEDLDVTPIAQRLHSALPRLLSASSARPGLGDPHGT